MGTVVIAGLVLSLSALQEDTTTFTDAATAVLYAQARVRHVRQDSLVRDYRALVRTRVDLTAGRSRFSRQTALFAHETVARVIWRAPNDLKIEALGVRSAAPIVGIISRLENVDEGELREDFRQELVADRPWFIPRAFGDSIRLMGLPERAALHPLAAGATSHYRYAIADSVTLVVSGRTVRAIRMKVVPKRLGPSLVAGEMWLDRETADVVRLVMVFVGDYLWEAPQEGTPQDSADARRENATINRFLTVEADVEYALIGGAYWLPHRQLLAITAEVPWFLSATLPARAVSTFSEYEVNTSPDLSFNVPADRIDSVGERSSRTLVRTDSGWVDAREGEERYRLGYSRSGVWDDGRWEVVVPPGNSITAYGWDSEFKVTLEPDEEKRLTESLVSLASVSEELPPQWIGRRTVQLAWQDVADAVRYNRVQGASLGAGVQWRPGLAFHTVHITGRFGFGDLRPSGTLVWSREDPHGRLALDAFGDIREVEPWTRGAGLGNTLNAAFTGHDDADYYFSLGGGFSYQWHAGTLRGLEFGAHFERHESKETTVDPLIPGLVSGMTFQENPTVTEGTFFRTGMRHAGSVWFARLEEATELLAGEGLLGVRAWGRMSLGFGMLGRRGRLTVRAGVARGDELTQLDFRLGGPHTVRGYRYGTRVAREFWSAQLDYGLAASPALSPVIFADVGDTFSSDPLVGAGIGVSLLNGLIRFDLSKGLRPESALRFELAFRAHR